MIRAAVDAARTKAGAKGSEDRDGLLDRYQAALLAAIEIADRYEPSIADQRLSPVPIEV
ncbi:MAG: hypothetical protein AAF311_16820 [Pseudomonadota bacterium]